MSNSIFRGRKVQNPSIYENNRCESYGSSLNTLNDIWSTVKTTKRELSDVHSKLKKSQKFEPQEDLNCKKQLNRKEILEYNAHKLMKEITTNIQYEEPHENRLNIHRKENIPPVSFVKPISENGMLQMKDCDVNTNTQIVDGESCLGKAFDDKKSKVGALAKLKEKISRQKINVSNLSNEKDDCDLRLEKVQHHEDDLVEYDEVTLQPAIKRKVVTAVYASPYKGFSQVDKTYVKHQERSHKNKKRQSEENEKKIKGMSISKLPHTEKAQQDHKKPQRVIAPKKKPQIITASSWRKGEELKKEMHCKMNQQSKSAKRIQVQRVESESVVNPIENNSEKEIIVVKANEHGTVLSLKEQFIDEDTLDHGDIEGKKGHSCKGNNENGSLMDDLSNCSALTNTAKKVLVDFNSLQPGSKMDSEFEKKEISAVVDTGISSKMFDRRKTASKRKLEEEHYPKQKIRHYNQENVQKYMKKQKSERRKKQQANCLLETEKKRAKEHRLQELYNKQKSVLKESLYTTKKRGGRDGFEKEMFKNHKQVEKKEVPANTKSNALQSHGQQFKGISELVGNSNSNKEKHDRNFHKEETQKKGTLKDSPDQTMDTVLTHHSTFGLFSTRGESPDQESISRNKYERVAAIRSTAEALCERLELEAKRIDNLIKSSKKEVSKMGDDISETSIEKNDCFHRSYPGNPVPDAQINSSENVEAIDDHIVDTLPSHTLFETLKEAQRRACINNIRVESPIALASSYYPSDLGRTYRNKRKSVSSLWEYSESGKNDSFTDDTVEESNPTVKPSVALQSLVNIQRVSGGMMINEEAECFDNFADAEVFTSTRNVRDKNVEDQGEEHTISSYSIDDDVQIEPKKDQTHNEKEILRSLLKKHKDVPPDEYSVINIFARKYPSLQKKEFADQGLISQDSDTEKLIADAYVHDLQSRIKNNGISIDDTLMEKVTNTTKRTYQQDVHSDSTSIRNKSLSLKDEQIQDDSHNVLKPDTLYRGSQQRNLLSPKPIPRNSDSESEISEKLFSPRSHTPEFSNKTIASQLSTSYVAKGSDKESSSSHSPSHESSSSDFNKEDLSPVFSSTKRSPSVKKGTNASSLHQLAAPGCSRMSPNSLERKLVAEMNLFDTLGDSLQQLNEIERVRYTLETQQESVALAQIVKSRQRSHQQELEKLSLKTKEKAVLASEKGLSESLLVAEKNTNQLRAIADVNAKTTSQLLESVEKIKKIQMDNSAITFSALSQIHNDQKEATNAYKLAIGRQIADVEKVAAAAAVAASTKAVDIALQQHQLQLEHSRQKTLLKVGSTSSKTEKSEYTETNTEKSPASVSDFSRSNSTTKLKMIQSSLTKDQERQSDIITEELAESESASDTENIFEQSKRTENSNAMSKSTDKCQPSYTMKTDQTDPLVFNSRTIGQELQTDIQENIHTEFPVSTNSCILENNSQNGNKVNGKLEERALSINKSVEEVSDGLPLEESYSNLPSIDEKFHSSFTEDEFKLDYRMVLPSENHRRKSLDHFSSTANETSSDELLITPRATNKLIKKRKSPFVEEDTFQKFTSDLVRQYIEEEELRAQHQAALLGLREKAIIDKTKAEMAFLEVKRKSLKDKGRDEKMPPIAKKQRALVKKLQVEQMEIRRLQDAYKAASQERKLMLTQQQEIKKIRESAQKIWSKVETLGPVHLLAKVKVAKEDEGIETVKSASVQIHSTSNAIDVSKTTAKNVSVNEKHNTSAKLYNLSENSSLNPVLNHHQDGAHAKVQNTALQSEIKYGLYGEVSESLGNLNESSRIYTDDFDDLTAFNKSSSSNLSADLKKLKYMSSKKFLTNRERRLQTRQKRFHEILEQQCHLKDWKLKILEEEKKLKQEIRKALSVKPLNLSETELSHLGTESEKTLTDSAHLHIAKSASDKTIDSKSTFESDRYSSTKEKLPILPNVEKTENVVKSVTSEPETKPNSEVSDDFEHSNKNVNSLEIFDQNNLKEVSVSNSFTIEDDSFKTDENEISTQKTSKTKSCIAKESFDYSNGFESSLRSTSRRTKTDSRRNDDDSLTEGTSDASDIESRLKGLENELNRRKNDLYKLRKQNQKEHLRRKEQALRNELQAVEQQINKENKEVIYPQSPECTSYMRIQQPRVLSPRSSLDSIILPEKIKIPPDKESRKSLDFWNKCLEENEKSQKSEKSERTNKSDSNITVTYETDENLLSLKIPSDNDHPSEGSKGKTSYRNELTNEAKSEAHSIKPGSESILEKESLEIISKNKTVLDQDTTQRDSNIENISDKTWLGNNTAVNDSTFLPLNENDHTVSLEAYTEDFETSSQPPSQIIPSMKQVLGDALKTEDLSVKPDISFSKSDDRIKDAAYFECQDSIMCISNENSTENNVGSIEKIDSSKSTSKSYSSENAKVLSDSKSLKSVKQSDYSVSDLENKQIRPDENNDATIYGSDTMSHPGITEEYLFSRSNLSTAFNFHVDDMVLVEDTMMGRVRFLGKTSFSPTLVVGVELEEPLGTTNGTYRGRSYFSCQNNFGLFTTIDKIKIIEDANKSETSTVADISEDVLSDYFKRKENLSEKRIIISPSISSKTAVDLKKGEDDEISVLHSKTYSKSEVESLDDGDVPSPERLDIKPVGESITNGILNNLLNESLEIIVLRNDNKNDIIDCKDSFINSTSIFEKEDFVEHRDNAAVAADKTLTALLSTAIEDMIRIRNQKEKLHKEESNTFKDDFMSIFLDGRLGKETPLKEGESKINATILAAKLKKVHDQLEDLLGDGIEDDDDVDIVKLSNDDNATAFKHLVEKDLPLQIPYNAEETQRLVDLALNEINQQRNNVSLEEIDPSLDYLKFDNKINENLDEINTYQFKRLLFDLTKSLVSDIEEFRHWQSSARPKWMKTCKKTFSKFTRKTHALYNDNVRDALTEYIDISLGLKIGRPSLHQFKKRLPLNPAKKDYVDAILVEEMREEETQWVNYDDDELKVKYQIADNILDNLLDEIIETLNGVI